MRLPTLASFALALAVQTGPPQDEPAKIVGGGLPPPPQPQLATSGGEILLELNVTSEGRVEKVDRLRVAVPFTDYVISAVEAWRFKPATIVKDGRPEPVESKVLVAALFRPPALYMGSTIGDPPRDVAPPSGEAPSISALIGPPYPPNARGDAMVLLEVEIGPSGHVNDIRVLRSGGTFDDGAVETVKRWAFAPPKRGIGASSYAYVMIGYRTPVVPGPPR
jgi:TonB family protein